MIKTRAILTFPLFIFLTEAQAQNLYLKVNRLFDGEAWITPAYLHVEEGQISYMGPFPYKNLKYTEMKGSTLLPPLVDAHQHLSIQDPYYGGDYEEAFRYSHQLSVTKKKEYALGLLNDYLHKGFLYLRDLGGDPVTIREIKREIKDSGTAGDYPSIQWSSVPVAQGRGQCPQDLNCGRYFQRPQNYDLAPKQTLKVYLDNEPFPGLLSASQLKSLLTRPALNGQSISFHSVEPYALDRLIPFIDKNDSLEHIHAISAKQLQALAPSKVRLVPTDLPEHFIEVYQDKVPAWPYREVRIQAKRTKKLTPYTQQLCFGSDFYINPHDTIRTQAYWAIESFLQLTKRLHLSPTSALKIITNQCAELFPGQEGLGKIRQSTLANFIIVKGDLQEDLKYLHNIQWVVKEGKVLIRP